MSEGPERKVTKLQKEAGNLVNINKKIRHQRDSARISLMQAEQLLLLTARHLHPRCASEEDLLVVASIERFLAGRGIPLHPQREGTDA